MNGRTGERGVVDVGAALAMGLIVAASLVAVGVLYGDRLGAVLYGWRIILIFGLGVLFLAIEATIPGFGVFGVTGLLFCALAIIGAGAASENGWKALGAAVVSAPVVAYVMARWAVKRGLWRRLTLNERLASDRGFVAPLQMPELLGRTAVAVTPLRPAGAVEIDGHRVDVVTEGEFVARGEAVRVEKVEGRRVVVRRLEHEPAE